MTVEALLPVLVPGILIQFAVQAYFIHHCWNNSRLTIRRKTIYIVAIVLFNIPATAIYLFFTRPRRPNFVLDNLQTSEDKQIRQGIFVTLLVAFEIIALRFIMENQGVGARDWLVWLVGLCFICLILDGLLEQPKPLWLPHLLLLIQIISLSLCIYLEQAESAQFMVLIIVAGIINRHPRKMVLGYVIATFILSLSAAVLQGLHIDAAFNDQLISRLYVQVLLFVLTFSLFYALKKQLLANRQLEQMSTLAERHRIVGEIHDTVGHTLTTAIIALESGQQLLAQNPDAAAGKIGLARDQVKRGLQDLRSSIRTIQSGTGQPFRTALETLLDTLRTTTDLEITAVIDLDATLLPIQQRVLLRAIRELATNSLKHGKSQALDLLLQTNKGNIHLTVSDDGQGADQPIPGFGLEHMLQQVEGIGGLMQIDSKAGEGFTVHILLPAGRTAETGEETP